MTGEDPSLSQAPEEIRAALKALEERGVRVAQFSRLADDKTVADEVAARLRSEQGGRFAIEQVESAYGYPTDHEPVPLERQIMTLKGFFPTLKAEIALEFARTRVPALSLPSGAESWFAVPRWQAIAKDYRDAAEIMLATLGNTRALFRYEGSRPADRNVRSEGEHAALWERLCAAQSGDILILPAQFGLRHAGRSIRRARDSYSVAEFGLGLFAVGAMLLAHPRRLTSYYSLFIQCPGDEYADTAGEFVQAPAYGFSYGADGKLLFFPRWTLATHEEYGSATGFLLATLGS